MVTMNILRINYLRTKEEYLLLVMVNISRIDHQKSRIYNYLLLGRRPKREYPSSLRVNISG